MQAKIAEAADLDVLLAQTMHLFANSALPEDPAEWRQAYSQADLQNLSAADRAAVDEYVELTAQTRVLAIEGFRLKRLVVHRFVMYVDRMEAIQNIIQANEQTLKELHWEMGPQVHAVAPLGRRLRSMCRRVKAEYDFNKAMMDRIMSRVCGDELFARVRASSEKLAADDINAEYEVFKDVFQGMLSSSEIVWPEVADLTSAGVPIERIRDIENLSRPFLAMAQEAQGAALSSSSSSSSASCSTVSASTSANTTVDSVYASSPASSSSSPRAAGVQSPALGSAPAPAKRIDEHTGTSDAGVPLVGAAASAEGSTGDPDWHFVRLSL